jgi:hypothetical protein
MMETASEDGEAFLRRTAAEREKKTHVSYCLLIRGHLECKLRWHGRCQTAGAARASGGHYPLMETGWSGHTPSRRSSFATTHANAAASRSPLLHFCALFPVCTYVSQLVQQPPFSQALAQPTYLGEKATFDNQSRSHSPDAA